MEHAELQTLTPKLQETVSEEQLLKGLTMPVEAKINDLLINTNQIKEDERTFSNFGFTPQEIIHEITTSVYALRSAETLYTITSQEGAEADLLWRNNREKLYLWRGEAIARLTYVAKNNEDEGLLKSLNKIGKGEGHPDAIQDGHELLELVDHYMEDLRINKLTDERVSEAKEIVSIVSDAFPKVSAGAESDKSAKELRDRAFWYCCALEKELKEHMLPLVFFDNYARRQEYGSDYFRNLANKRRKSDNE